MAGSDIDLDTSQIKTWRSIITLIVFVVTNLIVLFPFHVPIWFPRVLHNALWDTLAALRIIGPRPKHAPHNPATDASEQHDQGGRFIRFRFPLNFITAPLIADLFLLAILAIGRQEVHDGTVGTNNIFPIDIMVFFLTLAYIAISIDASGLIRWLAFKVLQKGGERGHWLYFYLYVFFFALAAFAGNDPIVLSGTAFLAYMTRVSSNIKHPRAWIHMQFSIANIGSAILVSSNPTNLVLAGAFNIKFIHYTANIIVPVVVTVIVMFPFLLYVVFDDEGLIPRSIKLHELPAHLKKEKPVNPNIKSTRENDQGAEDSDEQFQLLMLKEIMNPFLDKGGALFGSVIMAATLVTILALNASSQDGSETPVFYVTLPAAVIMFCWDVAFGWWHRKQTRDIARSGGAGRVEMSAVTAVPNHNAAPSSATPTQEKHGAVAEQDLTLRKTESLRPSQDDQDGTLDSGIDHDGFTARKDDGFLTAITKSETLTSPTQLESTGASEADEKLPGADSTHPTTLHSLFTSAYRYLQETFPAVMTVMEHLPFALVPFAFAMFVLVQALVTKGWVPVFAHGWDHWVSKTGTVGAIGGMAFLSVILCNFAGTNIGTTILLCRIVQAWVQIHVVAGTSISERTFWATVYSMAIGVNYGAFSTAFSASLAGMLWRDILERKHIIVRGLDFARVNLPIITIAMVVGSVVLVGEVYIVRGTGPYVPT